MLKNTFLMLFLISPLCFANEADKTPSIWQQLKLSHFGDRVIRENADDLLFIEVPNKVEDAALMPITIKSMAAQTPNYHIKTLHLIVDNNPQAYSAAFHFSPTLGPITLTTRIRMDNFSNVRIIAEMNDHSLHMVSRFVVASGGCSSPARKDAVAARARLGKMQIRMREPKFGETTAVQVIVSHPNSSGMQFDKVNRHFIPAHYITNFNISLDDKPLIWAEMGITISENPSIRFNFTPKGSGVLKAIVTDSEQAVFKYEKTF